MLGLVGLRCECIEFRGGESVRECLIPISRTASAAPFGVEYMSFISTSC